MSPTDATARSPGTSANGPICLKRGGDEGMASRPVRIIGLQQVHPPAVTPHGRPTGGNTPCQRRSAPKVSTPATILLHWQDQVKADLDSDVALEVIEKVEEPSE